MSAKNKICLWAFRCVILACSFAIPLSEAAASPITIDGQWYQFGFDPNHSPMAAGCLPTDPTGVPCRPPDPGVNSLFLGTPPWTFSSAVTVEFTITDAFLLGDYFDVYDFGTLIGSTPIVALGANCGLNPDVCLADPRFSHAVFTLAPGAHSITIGVHEAQILGEGFFRVTAVPEPSTLLLLGSSVAGLLVRRRARKSKRRGS
jgi:hypothetical protein